MDRAQYNRAMVSMLLRGLFGGPTLCVGGAEHGAERL